MVPVSQIAFGASSDIGKADRRLQSPPYLPCQTPLFVRSYLHRYN